MRCVRFAAVRAGATIPFERLCIKTGLPRGAHLCIWITQETASCPLPSIQVPPPKPPQARQRAKPLAPPLPAPTLSLAYPDAGGIDIGATSHFVFVHADRDDAPVGGKVLSSATRQWANRAAQALRMAAQAQRKSSSALGAYHRRLCARMDRLKAITATATSWPDWSA